MSCISRHWGVQLISAYSWARPAILVAGKGRGGMFLFLLFLHFHSCSSFFPSLFFSSLQLSLLSLFSLSLGDDTKWPTRVDVSLNPNTINQFLMHSITSELCMLGFLNFIYGFLMQNSFFFPNQDYAPFLSYGPLKKYGWNLVGEISQKLFKLESWNLVNEFILMSRWPDQLLNKIFWKLLHELWLFVTLGIFTLHAFCCIV